MTLVALSELVAYTDDLLNIQEFQDYCPNGLQVEGKPEVQRIVTGVTACQALLDAALEAQADLILVHHGYFWKGESPCVTGTRRKRLATLINNDMSLLGYHLPLDAHPELGNNARLGQLLEIPVQGSFAGRGLELGVWAELTAPASVGGGSGPHPGGAGTGADAFARSGPSRFAPSAGAPGRRSPISRRRPTRGWTPLSVVRSRSRRCIRPRNGESTISRLAITPPNATASRRWEVIWQKNSVWNTISSISRIRSKWLAWRGLSGGNLLPFLAVLSLTKWVHNWIIPVLYAGLRVCAPDRRDVTPGESARFPEPTNSKT